MWSLKKWGAILIVLYILLTISAYIYKEKLVSFPSKMPLNYTYDYCQEYEEFFLTTKDGTRLNAVRYRQDNAKGIIFSREFR